MKKIAYIFILTFIFWGCDEKNISENTDPGSISIVEPQSTFVGDTVNIFGENFGLRTYQNSIVDTEGAELSSEDAIIWNNTKISFEISNEMSSGWFYLRVNRDTVDSFNLEISRIVPFNTIEINAGEFEMGSENGANDEMPVHNVLITNRLEVSVYEVSARLFESVMGYLPKHNLDKSLPVRNVSWIEAVEFCNELSRMQGLDTNYRILESTAEWDSTTNGWRLPTEAEWEYLAKDEQGNEFPFGNELDEYGWYNVNSGLKVHPSGRKQDNDKGLYDMNGNVWEWCWDHYSSGYYALFVTEDPKGPEEGERHVRRGGSSVDGAFYARNTNRKVPDDKIEFTGFRIVRTLLDN